MNAKMLAEIYGRSDEFVRVFVPFISGTMLACGLSTKEKKAAFLAAIGYHTGRLLFFKTPLRENARYQSRGMLGVSGYEEYRQFICDCKLPMSILENPEMLELPNIAALAAGWVWRRRVRANNLKEIGETLFGKTFGEAAFYDLYLTALSVLEKYDRV